MNSSRENRIEAYIALVKESINAQLKISEQDKENFNQISINHRLKFDKAEMKTAFEELEQCYNDLGYKKTDLGFICFPYFEADSREYIGDRYHVSFTLNLQ